MKNQLKTFLVVLLVVGCMSSVVVPSTVHAQLPYGGYVIWVDYTMCTCPPMPYILYTPLWLGGILTAGPLVYSYATILYAYYVFELPGIWHLGQYTPGGEMCWMYVGEGCVWNPVIGSTFMMGTSLIPTA